MPKISSRSSDGKVRGNVKKIYVQVDSERRDNGDIVPQTISWADGRVWDIGRVIHNCGSLGGEYEGIRYTVIIGSEERYIYRAGHSWYVMA